MVMNEFANDHDRYPTKLNEGAPWHEAIEDYDSGCKHRDF